MWRRWPGSRRSGTARPGTPSHDKIEVIAILVAAYEDEHWPILPSDPVDAIKFHMEQNGAAAEGSLLGWWAAPVRASEILHRRRPLTVEMIRAVRRAWAIPLQSLIGSNVGERAA